MIQYLYRKRPRARNCRKSFAGIAVLGIVFVLVLGACGNGGDSDAAGVPWDYRIEKATVSQLIEGDMVLEPDNEMLSNDNDYKIGDTVWTLQYKGAQMVTGSDGRNEITLTSWEPIKTYKSEQAAKEDMDKLKVMLNAEVDLVGVYKTELNGETRQFAVLTLPSGQQIKQPINEERYQKLKPARKVQIVLEEVHDFSDYDRAYAKFWGWAS